MNTLAKSKKAKLLALVAVILIIATTLALTACNNDEDTSSVITKYDATFDASIVMGPMGSQSFSSIFKDAYVTKTGNKYSLTVIFTAGELNVGGQAGTIFVDDNPTTSKETNGIKDGTIGVYKANGDLITDGVKVTYSSGDNYAVNPAHQNVYYVQSVTFPVDELRATYDLTLYINSNMMGQQFIRGVYDAKLTLDLQKGEVVSEITGLGVDTLDDTTYTKYGATLDGIIPMGETMEVNFTENLLDGVYVIKKSGKYEITLIFKTGNIQYGGWQTQTGILTTSDYPVYRSETGTATPIWGDYVGETLKDDYTLTYSADYITVNEVSYNSVKSMTFSVDSLDSEFILSLCVISYTESSATGQQFPYTSSNGTVCNATLTIDLTDAETVDSIDDLLGVDTL